MRACRWCGGGDASGTAVAVTLAEGAGDDLSAVPSEDESSELHPVAPAIASALAAATTIVRARAMLHPATEVPSRAFTAPPRCGTVSPSSRGGAADRRCPYRRRLTGVTENRGLASLGSSSLLGSAQAQDMGNRCLATSETPSAVEGRAGFDVGGCRKLVLSSPPSSSRVAARLTSLASITCPKGGCPSCSPATAPRATRRSSRARGDHTARRTRRPTRPSR